MFAIDVHWRAHDHEKLINRDKAGLDSLQLGNEILKESDNLPDPDVLAQKTVEDLGAAFDQFRALANDLSSKQNDSWTEGVVQFISDDAALARGALFLMVRGRFAENRARDLSKRPLKQSGANHAR
jgi:hypothetical protein